MGAQFLFATLFMEKELRLFKEKIDAGAWLPAKAKLNSLNQLAVLPDSLTGLWPSEVQTLAEEISQITKALAGCDPQVEVRISTRLKAEKDLSKATEILEKIKPTWRF